MRKVGPEQRLRKTSYSPRSRVSGIRAERYTSERFTLAMFAVIGFLVILPVDAFAADLGNLKDPIESTAVHQKNRLCGLPHRLVASLLRWHQGAALGHALPLNVGYRPVNVISSYGSVG